MYEKGYLDDKMYCDALTNRADKKGSDGGVFCS
jgi:hypothetical protein